MKRVSINGFLNESDLIMALHSDSQDAFTHIYNMYVEILYTIAYKYLKDQDMAKDATQQIFLKLWELRHSISIEISIKNYLFTMTRNHILNEIRNNTSAMEKNYQIAQETSEFEEDITSRLEEDEVSKELYSCISSLPEQKRMVCLYKIRDGLSNQEIADKIGITIPTVKSHYTQAIKILRNKMKHLFIFIFLCNAFILFSLSCVYK
ncbi:MAG: RNA polymerase sigma-70 factor [Phocaeicola vulgatus]|nr:MAG: RNA polymerase sigma-70 factor [Phocaeicola vulgatus]